MDEGTEGAILALNASVETQTKATSELLTVMRALIKATEVLAQTNADLREELQRSRQDARR